MSKATVSQRSAVPFFRLLLWSVCCAALVAVGCGGTAEDGAAAEAEPPAPARPPSRPAPEAAPTPVRAAPTAMPVARATAAPVSETGSGASPGPQQLAEQPPSPHLDFEQSHPPYNTKPATSGWHYAVTVIWGVHDVVIPDEFLVHNLEHGGIGIHYNCPEGCDDLIGKLTAIASRYDKIVMSPFPDMDATIALTAWTFLDQLAELDEKRVTDFIEAHMSQPPAPEYNVR